MCCEEKHGRFSERDNVLILDFIFAFKLIFYSSNTKKMKLKRNEEAITREYNCILFLGFN